MALDEHADNVSRAETDGEGEGMHRRCWDNSGNHWDETCRVWEDGDRYAFEVPTGTSGRRMYGLVSTVVGSFGVEAGEDTVIWAVLELEPKWGPVGSAMVAVMQPLFRRGLGDLRDSWAEEIAERAVEEASPAAAN